MLYSRWRAAEGGGKPFRRGIILNRQSIEQRPAIVEERSRIGDWEADTVIGMNYKQAIVSLVERKSGYYLIRKVERKTAQAVSDAMIHLLRPHHCRVHTITSDNGREFASHESISKKLKADFYFAHPYASCERGTNENAHQWFSPAVFPEEPRLHHHHATRDR